MKRPPEVAIRGRENDFNSRRSQYGGTLLLIFLRRNQIGLVLRQERVQLLFLARRNRQCRRGHRREARFLAGNNCVVLWPDSWRRVSLPVPQELSVLVLLLLAQLQPVQP